MDGKEDERLYNIIHNSSKGTAFLVPTTKIFAYKDVSLLKFKPLAIFLYAPFKRFGKTCHHGVTNLALILNISINK